MNRPSAVALLILPLVAVSPGGASGQGTCAEAGAPVEMEMLLEKTIFNVDVLTLTVDVHGRAADRLRSLAHARESLSNAADTVARVAAGATCAEAHLEFLRGVSLGQLLDAILDSSRAARDAGLIEPETYELIDESLPQWYAFLKKRGVRKGDRMSYRIRGDTLRVRYRSPEGTLLLDRTDVGEQTRRSVLAGYFAPDSDFRDELIGSLFRAEEAATGGSSPGGSGG